MGKAFYDCFPEQGVRDVSIVENETGFLVFFVSVTHKLWVIHIPKRVTSTLQKYSIGPATEIFFPSTFGKIMQVVATNSGSRLIIKVLTATSGINIYDIRLPPSNGEIILIKPLMFACVANTQSNILDFSANNQALAILHSTGHLFYKFNTVRKLLIVDSSLIRLFCLSDNKLVVITDNKLHFFESEQSIGGFIALPHEHIVNLRLYPRIRAGNIIQTKITRTSFHLASFYFMLLTDEGLYEKGRGTFVEPGEYIPDLRLANIDISGSSRGRVRERIIYVAFEQPEYRVFLTDVGRCILFRYDFVSRSWSSEAIDTANHVVKKIWLKGNMLVVLNSDDQLLIWHLPR